MSRSHSPWVLPASILLALVLGLLPLPQVLQPLRQYWLALVVAYWVLEAPEKAGLGLAFIAGVDPAALVGSEDREVIIRFPDGHFFRFTGKAYLADFALPNFHFHATTAYAILRAAGVSMGKPDFLQHLGPPSPAPEA